MTHVVKLNYKFDLDRLVAESLKIVEDIGLHKFHNQISLKHTGNKKYGDPWYQGCGSLTFKFGEDFIDNVGSLIENEVKLSQSDFSTLNETLSGSYIEEVYNELEKDYNIGRARIMCLPHKKCMSMHVDTSKRIHIPLITNENCLMIINQQCYYMPADGGAYLTDVTLPHTALNANHNFARYHLLFDIADNDKYNSAMKAL